MEGLMLVVITYDVNTENSQGKGRLRKVAKQCENYGIRVQNSVFECVLNAAELRALKHKLLSLIDADKDSLRFYNLGDSHSQKVEHYGAKTTINVEEPLIF